ncbi:hypothetical protein [Robiginitomaculum antarcticum]|uniref:hypothetical protein n=1 Tax=Robiginitomaculum antarcticum TaxID=437507 RepID=UPI000374F659|nr:hypothetical protein [Robiginitomaculum antarcticum]
MPRFTKDDIKANQEYLKDWDDYQLDWLNSSDFTQETKGAPLLLPISVDIDEGIIKRHRIKVPDLESLWPKVAGLGGQGAQAAYGGYVKFFEPIDGQQSGVPSTPLDFNINTPVIMLFHLSRDNWRFTDNTQFSVDNVPKGHQDEAFEVIGTFDSGHGLMVLNKCWEKEKGETFDLKYNLHVSIIQPGRIKVGENYEDTIMRTDIIVDPGTNNDTKGPP